ncbi:MAG: hydroxymethylpyrimidine/phosphomethylpyrimidine kinase [Rhodocyclaceae bacterium]|nr:hydroxymethylpyrimidine/phosphomethylpyrimidine kinase [Rhodocyclaceae bacterium]
MSLAALGVHPASVVTGVTVQDSAGVQEIMALPGDLVERQARTLLADMPVAAFKLGVLSSLDNVLAIARVLDDYPLLPVVFDPVLASGRGDAFAGAELIAAMCARILPVTWLATPNSVEARRLAGLPPDAALEVAAAHLRGVGARHVLVTGTHEAGPQVINTLYGPQGEERYVWPRLAGEFHGSGCTLAAACAAWLARGLDMPEAVRRAQDYTWSALAGAHALGRAQLIPDRLHALRRGSGHAG